MHEQTHLLGGQKGVPLMLLPSAAAAEEVCSLLLGRSSAAPATPIRAAASAPSSLSFLLDLGCWLEAVCPASSHTSLPSSSSHTVPPAPDTRLLSIGLRLLCHSMRRCLPGCVTAIMDILSTRLGITPQELLHSIPIISGSIDPPSLTLLHQAMQSGSLPLIHSLLAWAELHSVRPDWTVAGPSGICPLHLAALLPNAEVVVRGMLELPRPYGHDIAAAWLLCRSSDGRTPAELGSMVGLPASLDSLAHDALVRATEDEPSFEHGANPGSVAKSISSASGASGIAAMMESLLTGEDGVRASCEATGLERESWRMPEAASGDKAGGLPAAAGSESEGHMGSRNGGSNAAGSAPKSNGPSCLNGSPLTSPSHATGGQIEAGSLHGLCRLLLLGFPDRSVEQRYALFKVCM